MTVFFIFLGFGLSSWLSYRASDYKSPLFIADIPNERSLHQHVKPRSGGIGIIIAFMVASIGVVGLQAAPREIQMLAPIGQGIVMVALISFLDDLYGVPAILRMPLHIFATSWILVLGWVPEVLQLPYIEWVWPSWVAQMAALLFVSWMINLYNFMDGMDGFAASMTAFGFSALAVMGALAGNMLFATLSMVVVAAILGFLVFNFPPSTLFMGDTGACSLGFLAALFSLWGVRMEIFPLWSALVLFLPFTLDATLTILGRISRLEKIWEGQCNHHYHWLLLRIGHFKALMCHLPLMVICAVIAIMGRTFSEGEQVFASLLLTLLFGSFYSGIIYYMCPHPKLR